MIAMMVGEGDADELADLLGADGQRLYSAVSVWETIAGLCRTHVFSIPSARTVAQSFIELNDLQVRQYPGSANSSLQPRPMPSSARGGTQQPSTWAIVSLMPVPRPIRARLLFKGDDFTKTDIIPAG